MYFRAHRGRIIDRVSDIYQRTVAQIPGLDEYVTGPFDLPATMMRDGSWLAQRVRDTGVRWNCTDDRVNGTLWWYSASSTLAFVAVATGMVTGTSADPSLDDAHCFLRSDGSLGGVRAEGVIDTDLLPTALATTLGDVVDALASVCSVRRQSLWAIASDSIANRSLDVGSALGNRMLGEHFAAWLSAPMPMPKPRFVEAAGRTFTRRCSCCLIYLTDGADKCVSCPRRSPADRARGLEVAASYVPEP